MMFRSCPCENELARAMKDGHWPDGCGPELRSHVDTCSRCSELALVAQTFQRARHETESATLPGSPSLLWWRAQLRRRNAATERVSWPLEIAERFALLLYLFVGVIFVASQYRHGLHWASWWSELVVPSRAPHSLPVASALVDWNPLLLISGFGVLVLLGGLVVYLASEKS